MLELGNRPLATGERYNLLGAFVPLPDSLGHLQFLEHLAHRVNGSVILDPPADARSHAKRGSKSHSLEVGALLFPPNQDRETGYPHETNKKERHVGLLPMSHEEGEQGSHA